MKAAFQQVLRCPPCGNKLSLVRDGAGRGEVEAGTLICGCGASYPIVAGLPMVVHPPRLLPSDAEFLGKYDTTASAYDEGLDWLFASFGEDRQRVRNALADMLELHSGDRVLEIGAGTGEDSIRILERIGSDGRLVAQDLSPAMLQLAKAKLGRARSRVDFLVSNAAYLPLGAASFDAVFHFGGINEFGDIRRSLAEMARVVRPGGRVVVGDEGVAPWLRRRLFGRILINANPLYSHRPPLELLPEGVSDVSVRWLLGNSFYAISFRAGGSPPFLDVDLPIPGRRGGSLRSRFEARRASGS